jgi:peptidyl-tRNA hydrolase, PTH1 family
MNRLLRFLNSGSNPEGQPGPSGDSGAPFLIVGLGNPGRQYKENRHNAGFMVVNRLAERLGLSFSRLESKALVTKGEHRGKKVILAKPQTFMNLSGQAVAALVHFYKVPTGQLLVAYDDVALPLGTLRLRPGGGAGGQKGMLSVIERLGTEEFPRLRVGIDSPPGRMDSAAYVLKDFSRSQQEFLPEILDRAAEAALTFIEEGLPAAMNKYNGPLEERS